MEKICNICDKSFIIPKCREKTAKVCSLKCRYKSQIVKRTIKKCLHCFKEFGVMNCNFDRKFCSKPCSTTYYNLRRGYQSNNTFVCPKGYMYVRAEGHHKARCGYVKRATLLAERKYGRKIKKGECVHHINENKLDDSYENLEILTISDHAALHVNQRKNEV